MKSDMLFAKVEFILKIVASVRLEKSGNPVLGMTNLKTFKV
jgi:hypothetical protein